MEIKKANDLVKTNEMAVVVFTKGIHFTYDALGNGETGDWVVSKDVIENADKVIIYLRDDKTGLNRVFLGNYSGIRKSSEANRHTIRFSRLAEIGTTDVNWNEFANSGQNPVSYVGDFY